MNAETIQQMIQQHFPEGIVEVQGEDGHHFEAKVISKLFIGKSRIEQQRMVYQCVNKYLLSGEIHALSLKTGIPA